MEQEHDDDGVNVMLLLSRLGHYCGKMYAHLLIRLLIPKSITARSSPIWSLSHMTITEVLFGGNW